MLTNQITGTLTKEQVRRRQLQKYEEDAKKYADKQKEKEKQKKAERWQRYSHVDIGTPLSLGSNSDIAAVRNQQQNYYAEESLYGRIRELERENARLRREEDKRKEKLQKLAHVDTGRSLAGSSQITNSPPARQPGLSPFANSSINLQLPRSSEYSVNTNNSPPARQSGLSPFVNSSINLQLPRSSEYSVNTNASSDNQKQEDNSNTIDEKKREEEYRREMRQVREKMQALYSQGVKKSD